jgi:Nuclease-related domain/UvrD-like helicase C-terminal domain
MRMIPTTISEATRSEAERCVFAWLKNADLGGTYAALHSLNISEHEYKLAGELDFVIVGPRGLLVLEVKGGHISRQGGIWIFTDRFGRRHQKMEGPFEQASSGMFALRARIEQLLRPNYWLFGFGVLFPDTIFDVSGVEWSPNVIYDASRVNTEDLTTYLDGLYAYWERKEPRAARLSPPSIKEVLRVLRPDFDRVPSLKVRASRLATHMERLTDEQYAQLDCIEENPRILCSGGAGTGKTFLAAEVATRHAAIGEKVLVVCESAVLASFLRSRLQHSGVAVLDLDAVKRLSRDVHYATLIVDEGQDLLNMETLDLLDTHLVGGLSAGVWRIFYDANNQAGLRGNFETEALDYLRALAPVSARLTRNCRNTKPIVIQTQLVTGADLGIPMAGEGPAVGIVSHKSEEQEREQLEVQVDKLVSQGIALSDITILSPVSFSESCASKSATTAMKSVDVVSPSLIADWSKRRLTFSTISDFKGLENNFILVVDLDRLEDAALQKNVLYVAMSRARVQLWLTLSKKANAHVTRLMKENLQSVTHNSSLEKQTR